MAVLPRIDHQTITVPCLCLMLVRCTCRSCQPCVQAAHHPIKGRCVVMLSMMPTCIPSCCSMLRLAASCAASLAASAAATIASWAACCAAARSAASLQGEQRPTASECYSCLLLVFARFASIHYCSASDCLSPLHVACHAGAERS